MSKINDVVNYGAVVPAAGDLVIGTDVSDVSTDAGGETVNFLMSEIKEFVAGSPALTGTPTAPTASADTDTTQIATTAFVAATVNLNNSVYGTLSEFLADSISRPNGTEIYCIDVAGAFEIVSSGAGNRSDHPSNGKGLNVMPVGSVFDPILFGAARDGVTDDAPFVQQAMDAAYLIEGTVYIAAGVWTFKSQVNVREGCTFLGSGYSFNSNTFTITGTVINVEWGTGGVDPQEVASKAAVLFEPSTTIKAMAFNYPDVVTTNDSPAAYGATVKAYLAASAATTHFHSNCLLRDLFFYKSYVAMDLRGTQARSTGTTAMLATCRFQNILMSALWRGIRADNISDWSYFTNVEQQPGIIGATFNPGSLRDYVQKQCTFIELGGLLAWLNFTRCSAWACSTGIVFQDGANGPVTFTDSSFDACVTSIAWQCKYGTDGVPVVRFIGCTFTCFDVVQKEFGSGEVSGYVIVPSVDTLVSGLTFSGCYLFGPSYGWAWLNNTGIAVWGLIMTGCINANSMPASGVTNSAIVGTGNLHRTIISNNTFGGAGFSQILDGTANSDVIVVNNVV